MEHHPTRRTGKYYYIAALCLVVYGILTISQLHDWGGWFLSAFFVSLALAFLKNKFLQGLSFTVIIFAAVSITLYYPGYFREWGNTPKLSSLIATTDPINHVRDGHHRHERFLQRL